MSYLRITLDRLAPLEQIHANPSEAFEKGGPSMRATAIVQHAIQAWEGKNADALASHHADDLICTHILPQAIDKTQLLALMQAITTAFPDWSFNGHVLHEESLVEESWSVLYVTAVTGTQTGDLMLPTLPIIPATGMKIALPYRHLEYFGTGDTISAIRADFSPNLLEEVLGQLGLKLP
jgi:hypothetical protein